MQQRAGRRDLHTLLAELGHDRLDPVEDFRQIGAPDIAAVDHAERDHAVAGQFRDVIELLRRAHEVEMQSGDGKRKGGIAVTAKRTKIACQHDLDLRDFPGERCVSPLQGLLRRRIEIEHQARLVDLHPIGATLCELAQNLNVDRQQPVEQRNRLEALPLAFGQREEGDGTDQYRPRLIAERPGLLILLDRLPRSEDEALILLQFRHHVVVVGVEPFRHFLRRHAVGVAMSVSTWFIVCAGFGAARHGEVGRERHRATFPAVDIRDRADHNRRVEYLVVERKIVRRDHCDTEFFLPRPVGGSQSDAGFDQCLFVRNTGPETFQHELEFTARTDSRRAECGDGK